MTQTEKIQLIMLHDKTAKFETLESLPESELDRIVSQIRLRVQQRQTEQARVELELVRAGLRNIPANWSNLTKKLGPIYSLQQARAAIETDSQFRETLVFDQMPFSAAKQEEQQDLQAEQERRRKFSAAVRAITSQGIANIADTDANYQVAVSQLDDVLVSGSASSLSEALALKLITGLAPNDAETVADLDQANRTALLKSVATRLTHSPYGGAVKQQILAGSMPYSELRERVVLCSELANSHSPDQLTNNNHFCSLFCSVKNNSDYRQQVEETRERKRLRSLSPQELRDENQRVRSFDGKLGQLESDMTPDGYKRLRPESRWKGQELNMKNIARLGKEDVKSLLRLYGKNQIDQRLAETRGF
jgi:hypothetical protein